jgi:hypothetical protein
MPTMKKGLPRTEPRQFSSFSELTSIESEGPTQGPSPSFTILQERICLALSRRNKVRFMSICQCVRVRLWQLTCDRLPNMSFIIRRSLTTLVPPKVCCHHHGFSKLPLHEADVPMTGRKPRGTVSLSPLLMHRYRSIRGLQQTPIEILEHRTVEAKTNES